MFVIHTLKSILYEIIGSLHYLATCRDVTENDFQYLILTQNSLDKGWNHYKPRIELQPVIEGICSHHSSYKVFYRCDLIQPFWPFTLHSFFIEIDYKKSGITCQIKINKGYAMILFKKHATRLLTIQDWNASICRPEHISLSVYVLGSVAAALGDEADLNRK